MVVVGSALGLNTASLASAYEAISGEVTVFLILRVLRLPDFSDDATKYNN